MQTSGGEKSLHLGNCSSPSLNFYERAENGVITNVVV